MIASLQSSHRSRSGSALILVLWTVIIMTLLIGTFAFEMHIEAKIATLERQRFKAQEVAFAGTEYARAILNAPELTEEQDTVEIDDFQQSAERIRNGSNLDSLSYTLPDGTFTLSIRYENGKRQISELDEDEWSLLLEQCNIPSTEQDKLIDCYFDWVDEGDLHALNGAESDDEFYVERGYNCKNEALESIDELLLIKNFNHTILYGGITEEGDSIKGIANLLTVWGDGKVNINSTERETLMTFLDLDESAIDEIIDLRNGLDGEEGTEDDGFRSLDEIGMSQSDLFTTEGSTVQITSLAQTENFAYEICCIANINESELEILSWNESFIAPQKTKTEPEQKEPSEKP